MKKLFFLVSLVVLLGVSSAWAQTPSGTKINPGVGDILTYSVSDHDGSTYSWTLTETANINGTNLLQAATVASAVGATSTSVTITWLNPQTNGKIYYLHVKEEKDGCENRKVLAIQPKNYFKLEVYNVDPTGDFKTSTESTTYSTCAPAIAEISWNGTGDVTDANKSNFKYNYGTLEFYYKVTASGINFSNTSWTPNITLSETVDIADVTYQTVTGATIGTWSSETALSGNATINSSIINQNVLWIKIIVRNKFDTTANANENLSASDFKVTINSGADQNGNAATITNNLATQTQKERPNTGNIQ